MQEIYANNKPFFSYPLAFAFAYLLPAIFDYCIQQARLVSLHKNCNPNFSSPNCNTNFHPQITTLIFNKNFHPKIKTSNNHDKVKTPNYTMTWNRRWTRNSNLEERRIKDGFAISGELTELHSISGCRLLRRLRRTGAPFVFMVASDKGMVSIN